MRKLGRGKSEHAVNQSQQTHGLVGLLETMRVQMEVSCSHITSSLEQFL